MMGRDDRTRPEDAAFLSEAEIDAFIQCFEDCSLPRSEWTHRKHLIMALWYLVRHPSEVAITLIRDGIRRYNLSQGHSTGYHETITLAWIAVIERFLDRRNPTEPISALAGALLAKCGEKDFLFRYYSREVLMSDEARHHWIRPDRSDFE